MSLTGIGILQMSLCNLLLLTWSFPRKAYEDTYRVVKIPGLAKLHSIKNAISLIQDFFLSCNTSGFVVVAIFFIINEVNLYKIFHKSFRMENVAHLPDINMQDVCVLAPYEYLMKHMHSDHGYSELTGLYCRLSPCPQPKEITMLQVFPLR